MVRCDVELSPRRLLRESTAQYDEGDQAGPDGEVAQV
jgi:hypothetical protein